MNYPLLLMYVASITLLIATPGPVVALVISDASRYGFAHAFRTVLGTNLASLLLIGSAALVISGLLSVNDLWLRWISLLGCVFIGWIAFKALRSEFAGTGAETNSAASRLVAKPQFPALNGFLVGVSNPKDIVFFIAFFPQFIGITRTAPLSLAILTAVWVILDLLILVAYIAAMKGGFFQRKKRMISILSAGFLLVIAAVGFCYSLLEIAGTD
ncbi:LysE family translocator [Pseudomonas sp. FME51]|uniref:LysE family translocator n=1 Tax=Pseudomonas sp. FME51 TaxID=2742609 RepID=UPI0018692307|nr:LysE family translocator [Pseudomonas sp. FME51]